MFSSKNSAPHPFRPLFTNVFTNSLSPLSATSVPTSLAVLINIFLIGSITNLPVINSGNASAAPVKVEFNRRIPTSSSSSFLSILSFNSLFFSPAAPTPIAATPAPAPPVATVEAASNARVPEFSIPTWAIYSSPSGTPFENASVTLLCLD